MCRSRGPIPHVQCTQNYLHTWIIGIHEIIRAHGTGSTRTKLSRGRFHARGVVCLPRAWGSFYTMRAKLSHVRGSLSAR